MRKFFADRSYQKGGNFRAKYAKRAKATQRLAASRKFELLTWQSLRALRDNPNFNCGSVALGPSW